MKRVLRILAAGLLVWGTLAHAQWVDPRRAWRTLESEHFTLHFIDAHRARAQMAARVAETVYPRITGWLKWEPESRTQIVLLDAADYSNGMAWPAPFNWSAIYLSPPDDGELLQNREWLEMVLTHEFTHIVHLDKAARAPLVFRRIFGRTIFGPLLFPFPNMFPNVWLPSWVHEGLATYAESDVARRYGRLGNSFFDAMMRAEARRGLLSLREINASGRGFPLNKNYLYGSYFFAFLAERYGEQAVADFVEHYSDDLFPLRVHNSTWEVTGKQMDVVWTEYLEYLHARFAPATPAAAAMDAPTPPVAQAFSLSSPALTTEGARLYIEADGYTRPQLMRQAKDERPQRVRGVEHGARLEPAPQGGVLLAQPEICRNYDYYYDLYEVDARGGLSRLTACSRFRFAVPLDGERIAALRVVQGEAEVVIARRDGTVERSLYRSAPGEALTGLAARGRTVVVTSLRNGRWALLEVTDGTPVAWVSDEAVKHTPRFGASEDEVYFVADYDKVYNVWSLRRGAPQLSRWTQVATGVREISAPVGGELLMVTIEADGDALRAVRLPAAPLEQRSAGIAVAEPSSAGREEKIPAPADRAYSPWSTLRPRWWYPTLYMAEGATQIGVATSGQDALGLHEYAVSPAYETSQHEHLGSLGYVYDGRHGLQLERRMTVKAVSTTTNQNNQTTTGIASYAIDDLAQWVSTWRADALRLRSYWGLGAALDRQRIHHVGIGTLPVRNERVAGLVAGIDSRRAQWLSEGPSEGQELRLFAETSRRLRGDYDGNVYRADWRGHVPLGRTVLSLRWMEAYAQPAAEAFELGGIGSEQSPLLPVLNQHEFPLRGYLSGEAVLTGHRARLGTVEVRVPLADIDRHAMVPPVGVNRVSMSVFTDVGGAWEQGSRPLHYYRSYGFEVLAEVRIFYLLGARLRAGVARGIDGPGRTVAYLTAGRSF